MEAVSTFPVGTGLGADNVAPRALRRLSMAAIEALIALLAGPRDLHRGRKYRKVRLILTTDSYPKMKSEWLMEFYRHPY